MTSGAGGSTASNGQGGGGAGGITGGGPSGAGGVGSGGSPAVIPVCQPGCDTVADCDLGSAPFDSDNYECTDAGYCKYTGCNTTSECEATFGSGYGCVELAGLPTCQKLCSSAAECDLGTPPYDGDNYTCNADGACEYTGCNSDAECASLGPYVCEPTSYGAPTCQVACTVASDCATASAPYDDDNYICSPNGVCEYTGCNSDDECMTIGDYVCI